MASSINWSNQTIWTGDNLSIMRGMNSESVDLIYLDPPFNSKANYAAPIGSEAAGAEFKDTWSLSDVDAEWINLIEAKHPALHRVLLAAMTDSDKSYPAYMAVRLLKPTGSIYLHCDPTMSHYLKLVMDAVFGRRAFGNEISWKRQSSHDRAKRWGPATDLESRLATARCGLRRTDLPQYRRTWAIHGR
ncbi:MAG: DNA methyltransferase [Albidovulum sp.]|nr:DNA methyltransferase [Albidovulum sp.]